ncbi:MAG: WbqC family protein [Bacteroidales bacterium]|nr:WbqC family protein [Bacteroidales bacterium]
MIPFIASTSAYRFSTPGVFPGLERIGGKERVRSRIAGGERLSVPVAGGASALKRGGDLQISQHGRWQDVHLGALRAVYGRTPWFIHLFPEIERIYNCFSEGRMADFTGELHKLVLHWIGDEATLNAAMEMHCNQPERFEAIASELSKGIDPELSVLDALFRLGPDVIFLLINTEDPA